MPLDAPVRKTTIYYILNRYRLGADKSNAQKPFVGQKYNKLCYFCSQTGQSHMKVSVITVCRNRAHTIAQAIESVLGQQDVELEYIVIDGASTDGTAALIATYADRLDAWLSEPDSGMYDAINKGIRMATGDVIGILNADDVLATDDTLAHIASAFEQKEPPVPRSPSPVPQISP